ncbi:MAG: zinc ribbon domain-containing protein [Methanoregula sp.]|uniref:zinc ribbon domain-containing protein n=1 Tax=Methanoregula sp. TaxID=2052170 RepID=UPI003D1373CE
MPMICPHCGKESDEESPRFCSGCGARMDGSTPAGYPGYVTLPRDQKNPLIAGVCSSVLPGLGQVYNGETAKGVVVFILALAGLAILLIPGLIVWFYGMYNAYSVAGKMNTGELPFRETRTLHMVLFIVFALVVIAVALLILITMVIAPLMSQFGSLDTGDYRKLLDTNGLV